MNLYALTKKECFKLQELNSLIEEEKNRAIKCSSFWNKVDEVWHAQFGVSGQDYIKSIADSPIEVDEMFNHPICTKIRSELNLAEPTTLLSPTSCRILNYYFLHCDEINWSEVSYPVQESLLSLKSNCANTCLNDLLDEFKILHPEKVPLAINRIAQKSQISDSDLRVISFLQAFPNHTFVFI